MVDDISVRFGGLQALRAVSLDVAPGEIHGLIGPNGAGKTTLFNVITGLQRPTQGRVQLGGADVTRAKPHMRARLGLGRTFQRLELFGSMSARENVQMAAEVQRGKLASGRTPAREATIQLERVGLLAIADEPTDSLPTGLARLVEVARALAASPDLLLLDEPSSGLNADETRALGQVLVQLAADGMGILLVEHDMELVMSICDRVDVLDEGRIISRGDPATVRADPLVQHAYLGGEADAVDHDRAAATTATGPRTADPSPRSSAGDLPALSVRDIRTGYGRIEVLHGVNLTVPVGTVVALLGPNGAGKTTTLNVVGGAVAPRAGCVHIAGVHVNGASPDALARAGVCRIPEGRGIFPNLTVGDNLRMCTYGSALPAAEVQDRAFGRFPRLGERRGQLAGTLSGGEQQMLAMARALVSRPGLLLLDEISMGLAPLIVSELYSFVAGLAADGVTVLLTEQFAEMALEISDYAAVMIHGRVVRVGQPQDVVDFMSEAYLGATE